MFLKISFRDLIQQSHYKYWDFSDYTTCAVLSVLLFCMFKAVVCVELNFFGLIFRFDLPRAIFCICINKHCMYIII